MHKIYGKIKKILTAIPINVFLIKNRFFLRTSHKTLRFLDWKIQVPDFISFYYEVVYIFRDNIYRFNCTKPNPNIIDGGACIGTSVLYFKRLFPLSRITAFEPSKEVFKILEKNILSNHIQDVTLINSGLYNTEGEITFSNNNIDSGQINVSGTQKITVTKLSNYITERVDFLKLNIEGAEYNVLEDLHSTGKIKMVQEMCFEWHSFAHQTQNLDRVLKILTDNNFKYYVSGLSTARHGNFIAEKETEYFLMVYAKQIN